MVQAVLDLHGTGLGLMIDHLQEAGTAGQSVLDTWAADGVVGGLLLLHGLHPLDCEARVRQALDGVRPYLRSHGGNVELLGLDDGVVRLRLQGSCHSCPSSSVTMRQTIEEAIYGKAPEVSAVEVEADAAVPGVAGDGVRFALPVL
jgi:Fe-S cluster biogenesis protein NfuA